MKWFEIIVEVPNEGTEITCNILNEMGSGGVVIDDPASISQYRKMYSGDPCLLPDSMAYTGGENTVVKGYLPADAGGLRKIEGLKNTMSDVAWFKYDIKVGTVDDEDWANAWKEYYKPIRIGYNLVVKPPWADYKSRRGDLVIEMDPGMAFGSGTHPTTKMCLEVLESYIGGGEAVIDVGTGSGIISIAAVKLGAAGAVAVDNDDVALRFAAQNVELNGLCDRIRLKNSDLLRSVQGKADIIVANIVASAIIELTPELVAFLQKGGLFISSGIIGSRADEVRKVIEQAGLTVLEKHTSKEWVLFVAKRQ
ncbi:MAG TPA: 50S ribosomal protein L11 methyltransferase [Clostridia bacterium]|nr:50S ribosomal protein L11 methyltransferase [Clostridia bacterium]